MHKVNRKITGFAAVFLIGLLVAILFGPFAWLLIQISILRSNPNARVEDFIAQLGSPYIVETSFDFASDKRHPVNQWFRDYPIRDETTYHFWAFETLPYFWLLLLEDRQTGEISHSVLRMPP
jgi:hypothetical protein